VLTFFGFTPVRRAEAGRVRFTDSMIKQSWGAERAKLVNIMREAKTPAERIESKKMVRDFNERLRAVKRSKFYRDVIRSQSVSSSDARKERKAIARGIV
jgi:hypothetical protein